MIQLSENLKLALNGANPLYVLLILKEQASEPGYNREDILGLIEKCIEYYEDFDKQFDEPID